MVISLFDLEILTFYLSDPFELFYYVRQRVHLAGYFRGEEMSLLAYHLNRKLYPVPNQDYVYVDQSTAQLIDANYPVARGHQKKTEAFQRLKTRWKNAKFEALLSQVKRSQHPGVTDGVFFLMDLSGESADALMTGIDKIKLKARERQRAQSFTMSLGEAGGISVVAVPEGATDLEEKSLNYAMARKYDLKAGKWLGLGCIVGSLDVIDAVAYSGKAWQQDPVLEDLTREILKNPGVPMNKEMKKIGRNDPCYCGSGKKYKKCHLK